MSDVSYATNKFIFFVLSKRWKSKIVKAFLSDQRQKMTKMYQEVILWFLNLRLMNIETNSIQNVTWIADEGFMERF